MISNNNNNDSNNKISGAFQYNFCSPCDIKTQF